LKISVKSVKLALIAAVAYYESVGKIEPKNSNNLKTKIAEIIRQISEDSVIWGDVKTIEIIDFDNRKINTESKFFIALSEKFEGLEDITEQPDFEERFGNYFHIYFSEYLKEKNSPAWIAYEKETLNVILNAVNKLNDTFDVKEIQRTIGQAIAKYVGEIPAVAVNSELQAELANDLRELKSYFQAKKIVIREIKSDKLIIEIPPNDIMETGNSFDELKTAIADKYYFEYNNRLYSIDELNEETFDYLTGKIEYNQLFTARIIEAIKDDCAEQNIYIHTNQPNWQAKQNLCAMGKKTIAERFIGIIGKQLESLFAIGIGAENCAENYVKKCHCIVKCTLDLVVFAFISQLWDYVHTQKPTINVKISDGLFMNIKMSEKIDLLRQLINIYKGYKTSNEAFCDDILAIAPQFEKNGELYAACIGLEKLGNNPTVLDCYFAEKHLTIFIEKFKFLVNYKLASMKKIEYFNIKNINTGYLHHYVKDAGRNSEGEEKRNFDNGNETINSLFTNAVLLYKGDDYTKNINLFPFIIDDNALNMETHKSKIAFFEAEGNTSDKLTYSFWDNKSYRILELEYKGIVKQKEDKNEVFLTNDNMKQYNIDCVFDAFREIQKTLFQIQTN